MGRRKSEVRLFIDDLRSAPDNSWQVVRTVNEAIRILATQKVHTLSLDYDAICHIDWEELVLNKRANHLDKMAGLTLSHFPEDSTFEPVAWFIISIPKNKKPNTVYVHSANPDGGAKLMRILKGKVPLLHRDLTYIDRYPKIKTT